MEKKKTQIKLSKKMIERLFAGSLSLTLIFSGCDKELAAQETYDTLQHTTEDSDLLSSVLVQELEVQNEDFKLITEYTCDSASKREWRITSDKFLFLKVYTKGLSEDTLVYIDNVHIDTSIKSKYATMDGILQDTMDDRIHNSLMYGFLINDNTPYIGVNAIEGNNDTFIQGSFYGMSGYYSSGSITQKRYTESDYMDKGVYGNKFQIVYDLLIKGPNDPDFKNTSVKTDFIVPVTSTEIKIEDSKGNVKVKE